jgi:hypothetical protein
MPLNESNHPRDDDTTKSEFGSEKEVLANGSTNHSSGTSQFPDQANMEPRFFAPPDDLLTHFDIMNAHVLRATKGLHDRIEDEHAQIVREMRRKHSESMSVLNQQFSEVYDRVRAVEHDVGRVVGTVTDAQETLTAKLEALAKTIQNDFVRRLDEVLFSHSEMARKVDSIAVHLQDLQVKQQYMFDIIKGRPSFWQPMGNSSFDQISTTMRGTNQHPHTTAYGNMNVPVEAYMNPPQVSTMSRFPTAGQHSPMNGMSSIYGVPRPNPTMPNYSFPMMMPGEHNDVFSSPMHNSDSARANGGIKNQGNGDGHEK